MRKQKRFLHLSLRGRRQSNTEDLLCFPVSESLAIFGRHDRHQDQTEQVGGVPRKARKEQAGEGQHSLDTWAGWSTGQPSAPASVTGPWVCHASQVLHSSAEGLLSGSAQSLLQKHSPQMLSLFLLVQ